MKTKKYLIFIVAFAFVAATTFGVEKTGIISGAALSEGQGVPGVSVMLKGSALQGTRSALTDGRGFFRFPLIPVGKDYQLTLTLQGFKTLILTDITVELGKETKSNVEMQPAQIMEEITVISRTPVVDVKSSTSQVNVTKAIIETLATDRQYQMIMAMMPGAVGGNNPFMLGGTDTDNIYLVDGMESTDPMTRTWSTAMNFDSFEEMQVIMTGAPAEYGRGTGAVINLVSKSGSNAFHGIARISAAKTAWNAKAIGDRYFFSDATKYLNETRPSLSVGGPIFRDRLWFFLSWERRNKWIPGAVYVDYNDWLDLVPTKQEEYYQGHYLSGKLTFKLTAGNTIMAQYMEDPITIPYLYGYSGYSYVSPSSDTERFQGGWNFNSEWTSIFGPNTFLEVRFNMKRNKLNNDPITPTGIVYYRGGVYYGGPYSGYFTNRYHDQVQLTLSHFAETSFGLHDLKIGAEYYDIRDSKQSNSYPGGEYISLHYDTAATPKTRYVYLNNVPVANEYTTMWTFFLQDKWEVVPNLTLNLGLRAESGKWKNHAKTAIFDWGFDKMLSPRLGIVYNLNGNKIHANYGRFYDFYAYWIVDNMQPDTFQRTYDYYEGEYYTGTPGWTFRQQYVSGGAKSTTMDPGVKPSYMDEIGGGYEHVLSKTIAIGIDYLHRTWNRRIEDYDVGFSAAPYNNKDLDGVWHFANATDFPDSWGSTYKKYDAFILTLKKNLGDDKFQFMASYTLSWLKGYESSDSEAGWGDSPFSQYNKLGWLPTDNRHIFKFNGNYFLPLDFNIGVNFGWYSGLPYNETGSVYYSVDGKTYTYYVEPRGSRRYPATWSLDLRLEKKFTFFKRVSVSLYADIFNVLNQQLELIRDNSKGTILLAGNEVGADYTIKTANLNYKKYTQWYPPTSFFFGAKIEF